MVLLLSYSMPFLYGCVRNIFVASAEREREWTRRRRGQNPPPQQRGGREGGSGAAVGIGECTGIVNISQHSNDFDADL